MLYVFTIICGYVLISVIYIIKSTRKQPLVVPYDVSHNGSACSEKCTCWHKGISYDFCYRLRKKNYVQIGLPFSCGYASYLENLELLPGMQVIDLEAEELPIPVFVTAMSQNHYREGLGLISLFESLVFLACLKKRIRIRLRSLHIPVYARSGGIVQSMVYKLVIYISKIANIRSFCTYQKILVYDLGLTEKSADVIKSNLLVELRAFPFEKYPAYVRKLEEYRWKALVIAMALKEFGAIWYLDTSVRWQKDFRESVYREVRCRKEERTLLYLLRSMLFGYCKKIAYLLQYPTRHSIYAATDPRLYEYFPTDIEAIKKQLCYCAGFIFTVKTTDTVEMLRWYVLCALEKNCMGPYKANFTCTFNKNRFTEYAHCHRYDQSVINLLLVNTYNDYYVATEPGSLSLWRLRKNVYQKEYWHVTRIII